MLKRLVAATAVLVLFAAGCGDDDGVATTTTDTQPSETEPTGTEPTEPTEPTDPDTDEPPSDEATVEVTDLAFADVEITAGGTVTWVNETTLPHTVTSTSGPMEFDEALDGGTSISITFEEPGTYEYVCTIHPVMTGTVVVS